MGSTPGELSYFHYLTLRRIPISRPTVCFLFSPGRFFAANELKAMLAYMVLNFDMKLGGDGKRPENVHWGPTVIPAPDARVLFRKRQTSK